ncbi:sterol esterase [Ophiostoma piceae UAMH 11346]|uniref:Carboxylic ester hydrolase n=1 Tax=Ophiostoma piceae (strain UAMH 11346) TaxID=1262450 RepID=S3CQH7_OPHP1|nr:sterol esterase [Ophiostoma piceae UAMH 11346]
MKSFVLTALLAGFAGIASASPSNARYRPAEMPKRRDQALEPRTTVNVPYPEGEVVGVSLLGIESFRGVPFAQPPVGSLRLKPPVRYAENIGIKDTTGIGPSCPQMYLSTGNGELLFQLLGNFINIPLFQTVTGASEDCLTLNVQRPAGTTANSSLPVLFWIFGGGFELGTNAYYDGIDLLLEGIKLDEPFIFVGINYRVSGFGFMGGKEIKADGSSNLGLLDQRMALEWVADNIASFGGDPSKVTIWGESAGSMSVFDQMALYDGNNKYKGKPLFRGGIMNSGSIVPTEPVDGVKAQAVYDQVVSKSGCSGSADTLACLRTVDYTKFLNAVNSVPGIVSYSSIALSYLPRPDGVVLTDSPEVLVKNKKYAAVPMIIGDQEDEGTLFAVLPNNITSTAKIVQYFQDLYFFNATKEQLTAFVNTYPTDISAGSPFRTGIFNELYPGFKRLAAILGDMTFTLARRAFLQISADVNPDVPSWSYLSSYDYLFPFLGTFHASDILQVFYGVLPNYASGSIQKYYINFVATGDPNKGAKVDKVWPQWSADKNIIQIFADKAVIIADNFRAASYDYLYENIGIFHI